MAAHLLSDLADTLDAGAVQVTVVLSRLDEPMALDVFLHLFPWRHKVVVPPIHLILPLGPRGICRARNKAIKESRTATRRSELLHFYQRLPPGGVYYADITLKWLQVAAVTTSKHRGKGAVSVTGSIITYAAHKIQTYQGTQTTGHH